MNQAGVRIRLGKVAQLPVRVLVNHFGEEAKMVGVPCNHFVKVIQTPVSLPSVDEVPNQPETEQGESAFRLAFQSVVRFFPGDSARPVGRR